MNCQGCGQENLADSRFCRACGTPLPLECAGCGRALAADARFCDSCGRPVAEAEPIASSPPLPERAPEPSGDLPTCFDGGRYQIRKFLGEGGKKQVYLAHDTTLDRDVAFALIKTEGLDDSGRERISREAQSMGRLGAHPHVVTVFDLGQEDGAPYMVTELMGGGDVEGLVEKAPDNRIPLELAIDIARATCRGLEFTHSRGIVHRDLKPGNVWLTEDGVAKIGDFGLAVAVDRSRLTQQGMMVGTFSYMPPEQALGGEVTPRSDLYSLGAMLYEMVTGRPPFLGDDHVAIIGQHINTAPVAPSWHCQTCPKPLEALILRLLAKDPAERPDSASDVLKALEAIDPSATEAPDEQQQNVLDSLAGGVFVGRKAELGELKAALEDALSGKGRMVTLVGEPGIGKTRTAEELRTFAGLRGMKVLWGRCYEEQGVPPYWPWVQAIRDYVHERDASELRSDLGSAAAVIAEIVPDVRDALPGLEPPPEVGRDEARFRLLDSVATFLKAASRSRPLMLVLDDLHWADDASLGLLQFVARELGNARVLVVGTYRDVELSRQHPLAETLAELTRERLFTRVLLRGLTAEDIGHFISLTSGVEPPKGLVTAVHTETEGNPLFVTEVVRLLVQEGDLTTEKAVERDSWVIRIPEGVREVIGRRLNRLSQRCNEVLTVAAVVGREFELRQLAPLMEEMTEGMVLDALEEALTARVIEEMRTTAGRYQFAHALFQETLTDDLSLTRRVRLHARIAETLESLYGGRAEDRAAELAHHFAEAQTVLGADKLVEYSLMAGRAALAAYAYEDALGHFQRGLAATSDEAMDATKAALLDGLGRAQGAVSQWKEALANLTRAFDYYVESGDVARAVAIAEIPAADDMEQGLTGASDLLGRAVELLPSDSLQAGQLLSTYGTFLGVNEARSEDARQALDRALVIARTEKNPHLEMRTLLGQYYLDFFWLKFEEAREKLLLALELAQRMQDHQTEAMCHFYAAVAALIAGNTAALKRSATSCLETAQKVRDKRRHSIGYRVAAVVYTTEGRWLDARESSLRGLELSPYDPVALVGRVYAEYCSGEFDEGRRYLDRLLEARTVSGSNQVLAWLAFAVPLAERARGTQDLFEAAEEAARTILTSGSANPLYVTLARSGLALIAIQQKDVSGAADQYAHLAEHAVLNWLMPSSQLLGLLAHTIGRLDQAANHFEDALAFCRKTGFRPWLAWCCCDYAEALLERDGNPDGAKATALLDEALAISRELGMPPLMERVLARREILKA